MPQFYGGRIQLLLPLFLTGDKPELALTIQREDAFTPRAPVSRSTWLTTTRDSFDAPRPCGSSDKWLFSCGFAGYLGCFGLAGAHEFKIEGKKFLVNRARLC